jgi:hypothetical protein
MRSDIIIGEMMTKVKHNLQNHAEKLDAALTAENAEIVSRCIMDAVMEAALAGFKTYIQENEIQENTLVHDGQKYQFNRTSNKEFSTVFGKNVIERRLYQNEVGESFVPLDHAWAMENQFATLEVREAVLFALSLMPACEARQVFDKCATFQLAESSFKKIAENLESHLEDNIDDLLETIRAEEVMPVEDVKVVAVSEDGVNVLLQEPGKKKGRKRQRPGERKQATEGEFDSPTSYKNAVVGSVSLYGDVPADEKAPLRLQSRYLARMPEDRALTLKAQLQNEVESTLKRLPKNITKVFVSDAATGIRKEVDTNPLFDDFEKIIDFFHTTDHLSNAAEAIFGPDNPEGNQWYESKRLMLLEEENGADEVYRSLLYYQKSYRYPKARRESLAREIKFFKNNKSRMEYKRFRDNGWPIGSGVIEAACKSVVKCRFCRSGMRWTRTSGQTILTLRTLVKSGRWDAFWNQYKTTHVTKNLKTAT